MDIIIVGGGIGGLTAAMMLTQHGHDVRVFEAVAEIKALGVGINLLPHAIKVLDEIGLMERISEKGVATAELVYYSQLGQRIWGEPRGIKAGYSWPQISIHRGHLQTLLFDAAVGILGEQSIVTDRRLRHFRQNGKVIAEFTSVSGAVFTETADILVAADGIHSTVRNYFYPDEGLPEYSGRMLWRATSQSSPFLTGASMIMAGHQNQKFVCYPISHPDIHGSSTINWVAELRWPQVPGRESYNRKGDLKDFLPAFKHWDFDWLNVPELIHDAKAVYEFPMVDRNPLPAWSFGAITLLGDAAHPMYPVGSNGASQAILDCDALTKALDEHSPVDVALKSYENVRLPATSAIVLANRGNGPEQCMQLAEERAPNGFDHINDVIEASELEAISLRYKQIAGFDRQTLAKHK